MPRTKPASAAADFDADTPPPRARPQGDPVPPFVTLPPGESALGAFKGWDERGRIPAGSVLCDHVGTLLGLNRHSGYRVAAVSMDPATPGRMALGAVGDLIPAEKLDGYRVAVVIREHQRTPSVVVMSPMGGR